MAATSGTTASTKLAAYVRNLTNKIVVTGEIDFNNLTGFINDPRTYGLQFKALF